MAVAKKSSGKRQETSAEQSPRGLREIRIEGFKSIRTERRLELSALNILAGANSSGKSSFMQPLLLLKQTLEAPYDPGPLLIDGPNVKFTELSQIFSKTSSKKQLLIGLGASDGSDLSLQFELDGKKQLRVKQNIRTLPGGEREVLSEGMAPEELRKLAAIKSFSGVLKKGFHPTVTRERAYLRLAISDGETRITLPTLTRGAAELAARNLIHVPGLRGNPERSYKKSALALIFQGLLIPMRPALLLSGKRRATGACLRLARSYNSLV
jgi:hypothetical protein